MSYFKCREGPEEFISSQDDYFIQQEKTDQYSLWPSTTFIVLWITCIAQNLENTTFVSYHSSSVFVYLRALILQSNCHAVRAQGKTTTALLVLNFMELWRTWWIVIKNHGLSVWNIKPLTVRRSWEHGEKQWNIAEFWENLDSMKIKFVCRFRVDEWWTNNVCLY